MKTICSSCGIEIDAVDAIETHGLSFCIDCVEAIVAPDNKKRLDIIFVFPNTDDEQPV